MVVMNHNMSQAIIIYLTVIKQILEKLVYRKELQFV